MSQIAEEDRLELEPVKTHDGRPNHAAAFLAYLNGSSFKEIADSLNIPVGTIRIWAAREKWRVLGRDATLVPTAERRMPDSVQEAEAKLARIKENRERNLAIARMLQEDVARLAMGVADGSLKSSISYKGQKLEIPLTLRDRCDLAVYATQVAALSYRALGDAERASNDTRNPDGGAAPGQITIVLPSPVAQPRQVGPPAAYDVDAEVISIERPKALELGK